MLKWKKQNLPTKEQKEAEAKKKDELAAVPERMDALEAANNDMILMMADLIGGKNYENFEQPEASHHGEGIPHPAEQRRSL